MVQMKVCIFIFYLSFLLLYIPHGSDERDHERGLYTMGKDLYIPHGSDERFQNTVYVTLEIFFISHMVQMKDF